MGPSYNPEEEDNERQRRAHQLYPVHQDQLELYDALKQIKIRLQNTHVWFASEQQSIWRIGDLQDKVADGHGEIAAQYLNSVLQFSSSGEELGQKLDKLEKAILATEQILVEVVRDIPSFRERNKRRMNCKVLGTFPQMMTEMEE